MVWLTFAASSILIVAAAVKLAQYGDAISYRTQLGGMFVGTLLMAAATSLPEVLTTINALREGVPDLAAGNLFGSNLFNIFLLAVLDLLNRQARVLRRVAMRHALTGSLATLLIGMAVFFMVADLEAQIGWVGLDSLMVMAVYIVGVRLIQSNNPVARVDSQPSEEPEGLPSLRRALIGFVAATVALVLVTPYMVRSSAEIAEITGLSTGFVGAALVAIVTSLPELVAVIAAIRIGAYDLAVGNLFGSNMFNMFALGLTDFFYLQGRFLSTIDDSFVLVGMMGLLLTSIGLIGNLARVERRVLFIEADSLVIMVGYFSSMWLLYNRGVGL